MYKPDIRLGGIYALERIARDSARDHPTVIEVLAPFIREHAHDAHACTPGRIRPDLQAALTVLGRRTTTHDDDRIDLNGANLRNAHLGRADLTAWATRSSPRPTAPRSCTHPRSYTATPARSTTTASACWPACLPPSTPPATTRWPWTP
jgi:hypothetical protein